MEKAKREFQKSIQGLEMVILNLRIIIDIKDEKIDKLLDQLQIANNEVRHLRVEAGSKPFYSGGSVPQQ